MLFGLEGTKISLHQNARSCAVDNRGSRLHPFEQRTSNQTPGLLILGNVKCDEIRFGKDLLQICKLHLKLLCTVTSEDGVAPQNPDPESRQASGHKLANVPEAHDAHRLTREFTSHKFLFLPESRPY